MSPLDTPLEHHRFQRCSTAAEVGRFLTALAAAAGPWASLMELGLSAGGRPLRALLCRRPSPRAGGDRLKLLLVGSQHGASEAAGCDALLVIARAVLLGEYQHLLDDIEFMFLPDANPDGRDLDSSRNAAEVNLNRDFVLLSQPESAILDAAVMRFQPDVVLDAHESASYKSRTLGREGYLTDFEAQFDVASSPAIAGELRDYGTRILLPALVAAVAARGMRCHRYIREITSTRQPITHGGLTARKFRNKAGLRGALTVLLETPMEPKDGAYPSWRNIEARVARQTCCISAFLEVVEARRREILRAVTAGARLDPAAPLPLNGVWVRDPDSSLVEITLRRRDTFMPATLQFEDWRRLEARDPLYLPRAFVVHAHMGAVASLLSRHRIGFEVLDTSRRLRIAAERFRQFDPVEGSWAEVETVEEAVTLPTGCLHVPVTQGAGRLLALLLDPRSASSVFRYLPWARLLQDGRPTFIGRLAEVSAPE